ncbi:Uncharacterized membrane protein [Caminicella sporogenes DSM 14501]|uniref:Uncharacterized membrane protein n=1 Tax=Caminicella sporogenes DSM 14501 TaxID=1121266 RepID=A0A1M6SGU4_9FIRM|nr:DMT family transporter [Caminicella sporogenes]RKD26653.1 hypothetical protein BET04_10225 [Caminicella sporogenes]SHK43925.1 Uncharacterized membrane protein [Caminicella sporogenes DSM 14501]
MKNGVILAILSSLVFSIMNAFVKAVSLSIPYSEVVFFRSIIGTILIYLIMKYDKVEFLRKDIPLLILRGVLGSLYLLAYFYTISKIPLADASILVHLSPFFVIIFSVIFLKEKISKKTIYLLPIVILGAILVIQPFNYSTYSIYALFGIVSAIFSAGASITIRYLSKKHHAYEIIFYFLATATLVSVPLMWNDFTIPTARELFYLVCIGSVSLLGQVFLTKAFTHEKAAVVAITRYIGIVFNGMWGFLFWTEVPDMLTVLGGILIVTACIVQSWKKQKITS